MTDKELRKLSRAELLEMLIAQTRENEELKIELDRIKAELASRSIKIDESGSLAEASLKLSGIFEAAQDAADQYLANIRDTESVCADMRAEAEREAEKILAEAEEKAAAREAKAKVQSEKYWAVIYAKLERFYQTHPGLKELLDRNSADEEKASDQN